MNNIIEIQKEFEILVSELNRLKSITDLTSSNAEAARLVVSEVEKFVKSIEQFKSTVDKDLNQKKSKIDLLLRQLDKTVSTIDENSKKSITDHAIKIKALHEKSDSVINHNAEALTKKLEKFADVLSHSNERITKIVRDTSTKIIEVLIDQNQKINSKIESSDDLIKIQFSSIEANLNNRLDQQNKMIEGDRRAFKRNTILMIISSLITIGLLVSILIK